MAAPPSIHHYAWATSSGSSSSNYSNNNNCITHMLPSNVEHKLPPPLPPHVAHALYKAAVEDGFALPSVEYYLWVIVSVFTVLLLLSKREIYLLFSGQICVWSTLTHLLVLYTRRYLTQFQRDLCNKLLFLHWKNYCSRFCCCCWCCCFIGNCCWRFICLFRHRQQQ